MKFAPFQNRPRERGNVLFYILIAVGLLAALSYAVSQSSRGSASQLSQEKARLFASEMIEYANVVASSTGQLRLRGVSDTALCYNHDSWGASNYDHAGCSDMRNHIFSLEGGGVTWANAPSEAMDTSASPDNLWHFYADNAVQNIGVTCAAASCADLIMVADEIDVNVCKQLNTLLGVSNPSGNPPTESAMGTTRFIGVYGAAETIGDEAGSANLSGQKAGCFTNTATGKYTFYKVLIAR